MSKMGQELERKLDENKYELLRALKDIKGQMVFIKPFGDDIAQQISCNAKFLIEEIIDEALAKIEGG